MSCVPWLYTDRRRPRGRGLPLTADVLEIRMLMADGITPAAGAAISAVTGVPITSAVFATYTIADASGEPGTQWRAQISFGDGTIAKQVVPVQVGSEFEFVDSHTYTAPGTYTVTIMIAVPGSSTRRQRGDNASHCDIADAYTYSNSPDFDRKLQVDRAHSQREGE